MSQPADVEPDLFERMQVVGFAEFSRAAAMHGCEPVNDRERALVDVAITAGVVGALSVEREGDQAAARRDTSGPDS